MKKFINPATAYFYGCSIIFGYWFMELMRFSFMVAFLKIEDFETFLFGDSLERSILGSFFFSGVMLIVMGIFQLIELKRKIK